MRAAGAERVAHRADLIGIVAGELIMSALLAPAQRAVGDHQRKLVPV
jgi:hypothetical protein